MLHRPGQGGRGVGVGVGGQLCHLCDHRTVRTIQVRPQVELPYTLHSLSGLVRGGVDEPL